MYKTSVESMVHTALSKKEAMRQSWLRYFMSSWLAGAYVGIGIVLINIVGAPFFAEHSPAYNLVMGVSFGIALTLVIFAGAELFTGANMYFAISTLERRTSVGDLLKNWGTVWLGNLVGALILCALVVGGGIFKDIPPDHLLFTVASKKMNLSALEIFCRGILCNWLVCLSIWTASRAKEDTAKLILIWWCLYAFISSGYEHSVANMTVLSLAVMLPTHPETVSIAGWFHNMIPATLGNIVGGALFMGMMYWFVSNKSK
ncbi:MULTISPECIES: formate/nitrite transporter family protein [unclassified Paenibacillus]|uniref:formate/nitrite transporter family protein n=1 Tax=unclassified Paenibacillus TaxID=185978 RepID=UPI001C10FFC4|nr:MULTISPECIES: formate/nitrite transporter family protein [unclassified Paenibacillus]MBU5443077.1 formate/nitrite transporter family protein [Paenibacillus sp. MSJ-34]CAH0118552.1 Nitrite transporter NirC [Paenibacillus sp. CECT 9249]